MKKCTACPSTEFVSHYLIDQRNKPTYVMALCVSCAENFRQMKDMRRVEAIDRARSKS